MTNLQPIGNRIMVEPIAPASETASGIALVSDPVPETTGRVIALGTACDSDYAKLRATVAEAVTAAEAIGGLEVLREYWQSVLDETEPAQSDVKVGDLVLFSWQAGQEVLIDGERVILLSQDDVLAVLEEAV